MWLLLVAYRRNTGLRGLAAWLILFALASGCTSTRPPDVAAPAPEHHAERTIEPRTNYGGGRPAPARALEQEIRAGIEPWLGTPHRYGGTDRRGVDCSGFVMVLYRDLFGVQLPRSTTEQVTRGERIEPEELQAGDLVFFKPPKSQHVGIYLSNGEFVHASASRGVRISDINDPYWQKAYWTSQRVLKPVPAPLVSETKHMEPARPAVQRPAKEPTPTTSASPPPIERRAGW